MASRIVSLWSVEASAHEVAASARAPGSVTVRRISGRRRDRRTSATSSSTDAQLAAELLEAHAGPGVGHRLGLDPEARPIGDHARTQAGSLQPADDGGRTPTGELAGVLDEGDDTDVGHAPLDLGHEEHPAVGARR